MVGGGGYDFGMINRTNLRAALLAFLIPGGMSALGAVGTEGSVDAPVRIPFVVDPMEEQASEDVEDLDALARLRSQPRLDVTIGVWFRI